jgi:hypothetical protein
MRLGIFHRHQMVTTGHKSNHDIQFLQLTCTLDTSSSISQIPYCFWKILAHSCVRVYVQSQACMCISQSEKCSTLKAEYFIDILRLFAIYFMQWSPPGQSAMLMWSWYLTFQRPSEVDVMNAVPTYHIYKAVTWTSSEYAENGWHSQTAITCPCGDYKGESVGHLNSCCQSLSLLYDVQLWFI